MKKKKKATPAETLAKGSVMAEDYAGETQRSAMPEPKSPMAGFRDFEEVYKAFDPKRAVLRIEGYDPDYDTEILVSVELGQPAGVFGTDPGGSGRRSGLEQCMRWAKWAGADCVMPCEPLLRDHGWSLRTPRYKSVKELGELEEKTGVKLGMPSFHLLQFPRLTVGWPGDSSQGMPSGVELCQAMLPPEAADMPVRDLETCLDDCLIAVINQTVERGCKVGATFDGYWAHPAIHGGHPWPFGVDGLILRGLERYEKQTRRVRQHCNKVGFRLARELHQMAGQACPDEFALILVATDYDQSIALHDDTSHTDEDGETATERIHHPAARERIVSQHVKAHRRFRGNGPSRKICPIWGYRNKRFVLPDEGEVNLVAHQTELMALNVGRRFRALSGSHLQVGSETEHWRLKLITLSELAYARGELTDPNQVKPGASTLGIRWCVQHLRPLTESNVPFDKLMEQAASGKV